MSNKTTFARQLRKNQTEAEKKLWQHLRNRQVLRFKFRRQYIIEGYIADFACEEATLIVELDGGQHLEQQAYDEQRSKVLEKHGFKVLRFWNNEVLKQVDDVLGVIYRELESINPHPSPLPQGTFSAFGIHLVPSKGEGVSVLLPSTSKKERELKAVVLGLGCDRGTPAETIEKAINDALASVDLSVADVMAVASIDKKSDEVGLLQVCENYGWQCTWYAASELAQVDVPNPSEVVMKYVGTPSVGEAAAILLAGGSKDDLVVEKYKYKGADGKNATVSVVSVKHG